MTIDFGDWQLDVNELRRVQIPASEELRSVHEAGHTVAAILCGMEIGRLTIRPEDDPTGTSLGRASYGIPIAVRARLDTDERFARRMFKRMMVVSMAARLAEEFCHDFDFNNNGKVSDIMQEIELGNLLLSGHHLKWFQIRLYPSLTNLLINIKSRARHMVNTHRFQCAVEALAALVREEGYVGPEKAMETVGVALKKPRLIE